jgi:PST family polysaccharide transporter
MTEGMPLLAIAVGPLLAGLAGAVPWIIPTFFGPAWTGVGEILPFIALGFLTNTLFVLHTSSLYVVRRSAAVALFHAVHVLLFAGSALLLVPRYGLIGYGWSEVAALFSYPLLHVNTARFVGAPSYRFAAPWWLGLTLPLFSHWLGWWCLLGPFAALLWPGSVRESRRYMADFMGMMHAR